MYRRQFIWRRLRCITAAGITTATTVIAAMVMDIADMATVTAITLPAPRAALAPARRIITERRSQRRFSAAAVPLVALASLLADMAQAPQLSDAIRVHLVVNRVAGLAPGVYRYRARHALEPHALEPPVLELVRGGDFAAQAQSAALSQEAIGAAAVVLVLSAEREVMLAEGARGYRHGFLEAGMIGVDYRRQWVLHFAALGVPAG